MTTCRCSTPAAGRLAERPFPVDQQLDAGPKVERGDDTGWLDRWQRGRRRGRPCPRRAAAAEPDLTPYEVAGAVARALPRGGLLVVGASNPIRDLDLMVPRYEVGGRRKVIANRGLSGIDGMVSTAVGAALGRDSTRELGPDRRRHLPARHQRSRPRRRRPEPDLTIVVVNDDGGSIFATLEQGAPAYADRFERLFGTPHGVDLAGLCAATRTPHRRVERCPSSSGLATPNGGIEVVEAVVRRDNRRAPTPGSGRSATPAQPGKP